MNTHLFVYPGTVGEPPHAAGVTASELPRNPGDAARAVEAVLRDPAVTTVAFWDLRLGSFPWAWVGKFVASGDDAWHPGVRLTGPDEPDLLRHVEPTWANRPAPDPNVVGAVNWRLDLRATLVRAHALRAAGGLDGGFETLPGMARELGLRLMKRGGVVRQQPEMLRGSADRELPSLADRYRLIDRNFSSKWRYVTFARRLLSRPPIATELRALVRSSKEVPPAPRPALGALHRDVDTVRVPDASVSVVLPTFGRNKYLAEVLEDLRNQTIKPTQILIADGNPVEGRDPEMYERFKDLPLEVIYYDGRGACAARNVLLPKTTGDYVWFVDDDSRFEPDNLEKHLRVMEAYGADVSVGPAFTRNRPELHAEQREIAVGFMDCGTTVIKRSMLERIGGFDMQFAKNLPLEDSELGLRVLRAGGLMLNNPLAKRFHYLAPIGGARSSRSNVHRWSRWALDVPRPSQSVYYQARLHFDPEAAIDAVVQACVFLGWRRREGEQATRWTRLRTLAAEVAAIPVTAWRLRLSIALAKQMLDEGQQIPAVEPVGDRQARAR